MRAWKQRQFGDANSQNISWVEDPQAVSSEALPWLTNEQHEVELPRRESNETLLRDGGWIELGSDANAVADYDRRSVFSSGPTVGPPVRDLV